MVCRHKDPDNPSRRRRTWRGCPSWQVSAHDSEADFETGFETDSDSDFEVETDFDTGSDSDTEFGSETGSEADSETDSEVEPLQTRAHPRPQTTAGPAWSSTRQPWKQTISLS